ncbi:MULTISPECIES: ImmA/IrrE family metallo-endopeptidase [unclassified Methylophaga]|uniref:ImmA/IrrE family metallo-endopeptidase n=1 Tax=unclassified Methylophaga TaxID=2629249 RepID=UPI000C97C870|nr:MULTISPECIES: ImmA/IrrE family metallo-endopeptidase [unclassified Methylophaga]MBN47328.1 hypothetical protein [Methylophaga sp.]|tara:strand:+ start:127717 stop:128811 length:1095 start_codon:yes stop_codon:yes gene_type:complete
MELSSFSPDWTSAPGRTIVQVLEAKDITLTDFSKSLGINMLQAKKLIGGDIELDLNLANKLSEILGASTEFWLNREKDYRDDLERLYKSDLAVKQWLDLLPIRDMVKFGWLERARTLQNKLELCLNFFEVRSIQEWYTKYNDKLLRTAFRTSKSFDSSSESVVTWLRQGEILSSKRKLSRWNREKLENRISEIKKLSRLADPKEFFPKLLEIFESCGVAVVLLPTPEKCRASGATFFNNKGHPVMIISFRYLSDDHFWFTLFHEIGHLVLHGEGKLFIEGDNFITEKEEEEANVFAENVLIPVEFRREFSGLSIKTWRQIPRFAKKLDISAGIVVGQLQHNNYINRNQLNKFKARYNKQEVFSL